jgi:transcriptional regulator with XRE-family HTH domain
MYAATAQRALVGDMVRQYREKAGLDLGDVAAILGCDRSKISRIENGERGFRPAELRALLTELGVDEGAQDLLAAVSGWRDIPGWWKSLLSVLPGPYLDFVIPETFASCCLIYAPTHIPEPLCVKPYAEALISANVNIRAIDEPAVVEATQARREWVFNECHIRLSVVIGEAALRQRIGGIATLRQQLKYLAELTRSEYPRVAIRVLPFDADIPQAGAVGGFSLLQFDSVPDVRIASVPDPNGGRCVHDKQLTASYARTFPLISAHALGHSQSARKITQMANRLTNLNHTGPTQFKG